ncbi:MAG TPA: murein biosynthesis integral membrane protein MurJ [Alphaproteobacteria bacterium]|nr:murein biosynthesis integral membrane protein MurJ [Alphaproteobacteria bacterium]
MSLMRAIATVGGLTLVSRVAGFARDVLTAAVLGAGPVADAFFVALKLPNFFRRLSAEGAFSVSFVPLFSAELERGGRPAAIAFAEEALAVMIAILAPFTLLAILGMPWLMVLIAPGFTDDPEKYDLAVQFSRITFPYLMLMSLTALMGGVLNSVNRFAPFAAAPILFNLTLIACLLLVAPMTATAGHALAYGVAASGVLQLVWLAWSCRRAGITLRLPWPRRNPRVDRLFRLMAPGAIGAGVMQINLFIDIVIASLLPTGAVSYLYYADRLNQLPLGTIGIAIGTALLPVLARQVEAQKQTGDPAQALETQNRALEYSLFLALPATVALVVIPGPIIDVLFERGAFGPEATAATALALAAYAIGIPAYVLTKVLSTAFFARQDTATPVKISVVTVAANAALALSLVGFLGHVGIALATGLTAWINVGLLARGLRRRDLLSVDGRLRRRGPRLLFSSAVMGAALHIAVTALEAPLDAGLAVSGPTLALIVGLGAVVYFGAAFLTGAASWRELGGLLRRRRQKPA